MNDAHDRVEVPGDNPTFRAILDALDERWQRGERSKRWPLTVSPQVYAEVDRVLPSSRKMDWHEGKEWVTDFGWIAVTVSDDVETFRLG